MNSGQSVLVVGGGVIGLASAYYLERAGFTVTVIDQATIGGACSHANCGYICPSHVLPLTEPGALATGLKSMFKRGAPFRIAPRLDPALWGWLLQFARRCRHQPMIQAGHALQAILNASHDQYQALMTAEQLECEWQETGLLYVCRSAAGMEQFARMDHLLTHEFGVQARRMTPDEVQAFDPAFKPDLAGAFLYENDASLRPERFVRALRTLLEQRGVTLIEHCALHQVNKEDGRIVALVTDQEEMIADQYLLAAGAWAPNWQKALECRLPIQPGKGYSMTLDRTENTPRYPTLFPEHRVGVSPFHRAVRLGSIMEFNGYDSSIHPKRINLLRDSANLYLREPMLAPARETWFGWRPMTYDSLPIIGPAPTLQNLYLAVGHNMLGMTLAPATGRLITELMTGSQPHIDPSPYHPSRF